MEQLDHRHAAALRVQQSLRPAGHLEQLGGPGIPAAAAPGFARTWCRSVPAGNGEAARECRTAGPVAPAAWPGQRDHLQWRRPAPIRHLSSRRLPQAGTISWRPPDRRAGIPEIGSEPWPPSSSYRVAATPRQPAEGAASSRIDMASVPRDLVMTRPQQPQTSGQINLDGGYRQPPAYATPQPRPTRPLQRLRPQAWHTVDPHGRSHGTPANDTRQRRPRLLLAPARPDADPMAPAYFGGGCVGRR